MHAVRPRRLIHVGSVLASGVALDLKLVPEPIAHFRVLELARPGSEVFAAGSALIVRFREPMRMKCDMALGTPLLRYGRLLSACPLEKDERTALETGEDAAVLVSGGEAIIMALQEASRIDVSLWLDVSEFSVIFAFRPLGKIALEPSAQITPAPADLRRSLGVAPLDPKSAKLLQALLDRNAAKAAKTAKTSSMAQNSLLGRIRRASAAAIRFASRLFGKSQPSLKAAAKAQTVPAQALAPPRLSLRSRLQQYLARALWSSQLGHVLGRQYGKYLSRLLGMFDENDLDNALKHAIALDRKGGAGTAHLPIWTPAPRKDLSIKTGEPLTAKSLGFGAELYEMLRERYRRAFQRLEAKGEIEKAAFVLAELLNVNEEAVTFLEKHQRFRLAAEIAESRALPPGLAIRLWFLAGDRERAIRLARRSGAFADAVLRLDVSHKKEAAALRLIWAHILAEGGQYAAASDVALPVEEARNLVLAWMDKAIETGGVAGATMLARKLRLRPDEFESLRESILRFLREDDDAQRDYIGAFGKELIAAPPFSEEMRLMARVTARKLIAIARDKEELTSAQKLVDASGDAILRADVKGSLVEKSAKRSKSGGPLAQRSTPVSLHRTETDRGSISLTDAVVLPDGKTLVAAGELGALLLSRDGKTLVRFSEPATHIVVSDHGDRAILLAQRGEAWRLTRVDLLTKRQIAWCDARFDLFAPDFDGLTWFVARGGTLYAIDALAERWEHLWKVDESAARIISISRNANSLGAFFKWEGRYPETWAYEYPSLTLRNRRQINQGEGHFTAECVSASGDFAGWRFFNDMFAAYINIESGWVTLAPNAAGNTKAHCVTNEWIVLSSANGGKSTVYVLDYHQRQVRARIEFEGADIKIAARIQDSKLIVCDDKGRVMILDLFTGALVREHRTSSLR